MAVLYFELHTTGRSPLFSMISQIDAVKLFDGSAPEFFSKAADVLSDEQKILKDFSAFAEGSLEVAYPDAQAISYLKECLKQYHMDDFTKRLSIVSPDKKELDAWFDSDALISDKLIYRGTLKCFYPDYKNYYYLPAEDYAVFKSIGEAVDPSARCKATKETAYTKITGTFVPAPVDAPVPLLKKDYYDSETFCQLKDADAHVLLHLLLKSNTPQDAS